MYSRFNAYGNQSKDDRFHQGPSRAFVPEPARPGPPKPTLEWALPDKSQHLRPADEFRKGAAGDVLRDNVGGTRYRVQVSAASRIGDPDDPWRSSYTNHSNAPRRSITKQADYVLPEGYSEKELHQGTRRSSLPDIELGRQPGSWGSTRVARGVANPEVKVEPTKTAHQLDYCAGWSQQDRRRYYADALRKVGEDHVDNILNLVREKVENKTKGGLARLQNVFHFFDADHSRTLDIVEFSNALESLGCQFTDTQLLALFATFDKNLNGSISYEVFGTTMLKERPYRRPSLPDRSKAQSYTSVSRKSDAPPGIDTKLSLVEGPTSPAEKIKAHWAGEADASQAKQPVDLRVRPPQFRQFHY